MRLRIVEGPNATDLREDMTTASCLAGDDAFDLVYMDVTWTAKLAAAGWLRPLDGDVPPAEREGFLPGTIAVGSWRGRLYRLPVRTDLGLLFERSDWLSEAGIPSPRTFDDLREAAKRLQSPPDRFGFVWQGRQYEGLVCTFLEVLTGHGGTWVDVETGAVGLDRPEAVAALEFLRACREEGGITPPGVTTYQEEESRRLFQDGRAAFLRNWPYVWSLAHAPGSPLAGRIAARPMVAAPGGRPACALGGWGLGVSRFSRHPAEAVAFARFLASIEGQRLLCRDSGFAPALAAAYRDPDLLAANPFLAEIERAHPHAVARPSLPRYALVSDVLQRALSAAISGREAPRDALERAARETRAILGEPAR